MALSNGKWSTIGLRRVVEVVEEDKLVLARSARRPIVGVAYVAQKCRLVPDEPDVEGNESYACKISDVSDTGFGVVCRIAEKFPALFAAGSQMTLEAGDGTRVRVQIQWTRDGRVGLRRIASKSR